MCTPGHAYEPRQLLGLFEEEYSAHPAEQSTDQPTGSSRLQKRPNWSRVSPSMRTPPQKTEGRHPRLYVGLQPRLTRDAAVGWRPIKGYTKSFSVNDVYILCGPSLCTGKQASETVHGSCWVFLSTGVCLIFIYGYLDADQSCPGVDKKPDITRNQCGSGMVPLPCGHSPGVEMLSKANQRRSFVIGKQTPAAMLIT